MRTWSKCKISRFQVQTTSFLCPHCDLTTFTPGLHCVLQVPTSFLPRSWSRPSRSTTCSLRSYYVQQVRTMRSPRAYHAGTRFSDLIINSVTFWKQIHWFHWLVSRPTIGPTVTLLCKCTALTILPKSGNLQFSGICFLDSPKSCLKATKNDQKGFYFIFNSVAWPE